MDGPSAPCVVVTGARGNLGRPVVERLLRDGARVIGIDRHPADASWIARLGAADRFAHAQASLADEAAVEAAFAEAERRFGPLWALVNLAGAWTGGVPAHEAPLAVLEQMLDANLRGAYVASRAALRRLVAQRRGGRLVFVSAYSAFAGSGLAGSAAYAAAKMGVVGLCRALAEEGAPHGIRANCLAPGTLRTASNAAAMPGADPSRWVPLEDVAEAVAFLCSPGSRSVNGAVLTLPSA